ncbi:HIT-like domain [Propionibacterium ruminifibrarum]|uniref:HIT-like domain n=1 Tax=Propionibacterium ruminifibrarum TaxID=1962131 RepID=A0A375I2A4_9ACTN|nr:HIT domain-containing protein [Propionibacterium ruminifibrarum]SPF67356.1 HIT-like domain [Propionibacterium ruminifibrarum]
MSDSESLNAAAGGVEWVENLPGVPDALQRLWTPHRASYVGGEGKPADSDAGPQCPFCRAPEAGDDEASLIVRRGRAAYVVLNLYPYNPGHLLVCPYRHVAEYADTTEDEAEEVARLTKQAIHVVRHVSAPAGFNIGMNQGDAAGAGIAAHLHQHVVPRWLGDTNFLPIIGRTKAVPQLLSDTRSLFADAWVELFGPYQEVPNA